jgi:hypothetical protein
MLSTFKKSITTSSIYLFAVAPVYSQQDIVDSGLKYKLYHHPWFKTISGI